MCPKCFKYKIKNNIIIKILILMAYFIHKYMFKNTKSDPLIVRVSKWLLGLHTCIFLRRGGRMLQICQPASFVSNSLSIPFPKDRCQVFLDCHLLSVAAVAVCEDPIWVSLGKRLQAVVHCFSSAEREKQEAGFTTIASMHLHLYDLCMYSLWCWGGQPLGWGRGEIIP